jgi:hypothetical protein
MAGNGLTNASFLDGVGAWTAVGGTLSVDEGAPGRGGQGRAVLTATRNATAGGQTAGARSQGIAVVAGRMLEVACLYGSTATNVEAALAVYSGATLLSRTVLPRGWIADGPSRHGAPETLNSAYALMAAPNTGDAKIEVVATSAAAGAMEAWLSKPYLDGAWQDRKTYVWDPGAFDNIDLAGYRVWPPAFPPVLLEGYSAKKTPIREASTGDGGREETIRKAGIAATRLTGRMRMTRALYADLEAFFGASDQPFLFVRPDTAQLCKATWLADGEPDTEPTGVGDVYASFGLQLVVL